ncbi:MAG: SpoIIE family protein phosphatase [Acidobacteria bacterium]|nr:SpoIIE family protein phosphatase [Acidobacteriota bacterium]
MATTGTADVRPVDVGALFRDELREQLVQRRQCLQQALSRGQAVSAVRLLEQVDQALTRLDAGSLGICELCHTPVETDRLIADPLVRFCIDHLPQEKQRALEADLELAARLQSRLLPPKDFHFAGWRVAYHYQPAGIVSGDYCDLATTAEGALYFALADVSGKGVAASLLMSNLSAMFRTLAPLGIPVAELMSHANRVFCESTLPTQYATVVVGKAMPDGVVEFANAGHLEPLIVGSNSVTRIPSTGLPIGLFRDEPVKSATMRMEREEVLVLYSDGITETSSAADEEYGAERLARIVAHCRAQSPDEHVARCIADLAAFRGHGPQADDETLMVLQRADS